MREWTFVFKRQSEEIMPVATLVRGYVGKLVSVNSQGLETIIDEMEEYDYDRLRQTEVAEMLEAYDLI